MSTRNMDTKTDAELQAVCNKLGIRPGNRNTMIARITHKSSLVPAPKKAIQKNVPKKSVPKNVPLPKNAPLHTVDSPPALLFTKQRHMAFELNRLARLGWRDTEEIAKKAESTWQMFVKDARYHNLDEPLSPLHKTLATSNKTGHDYIFDEIGSKEYRTWMKRRMMHKNVPDHLLRFFLTAYGQVHGQLRTNKQLVGAVVDQLGMETADEDEDEDEDEDFEDEDSEDED
jgi:hypothetical protein